MTTDHNRETALNNIHEIVNCADSGNLRSQKEYRSILVRQAEFAIGLLQGGPVEGHRRALVRRLSDGSPARRDAVNKTIDTWRAELLGPDPSPLERLLVDRILVCWLQVQAADRDCLAAEKLPAKQADYRQRTRDRAHRRLLSAVKTLATVRKLALPALQVNIADQQINTTG